ncbi:Pol polyprotein [Thelohanellus kitauei]|uniref:Pol polyprotein n=1 Tax=Thelohanellus kitauei TaxID=669202 RepID=A0A0C2J0X6_THEKT|nr:Pol polyprotein [Thelohanellus kitauei]
MQKEILGILHRGHFGMVRMKQLARICVYWPNIDADIEAMSRSCTSCAEYQNSFPKAEYHSWAYLKQAWQRLHIDHTINFLGSNWLIIVDVVDAFSKYPIIHRTASISSDATIKLLEQDFSLFGYPIQLISDNGATFTSEELRNGCKETGIHHVTGAPYHPATNGLAERLIQTFKRRIQKSIVSEDTAIQEFLLAYRQRTLSAGKCPVEHLMNMRTEDL